MRTGRLVAIVIAWCLAAVNVATAAPSFAQTTVTFVRLDGLQTGTAVVPIGGYTQSQVPRDRRIVIATTAGDPALKQGIASIRLTGDIRWNCTTPGSDVATLRQGTLGPLSDEERNGTSPTGSPAARNAHFTIDPFEGNALRLVCPCADLAGPLTLSIRLVATNRTGVTVLSAPITITYAAQQPSCAALGGVCGDKTRGAVLSCPAGSSCRVKRNRVCTGWWIFSSCDYIETIDMFCQVP